MVSELRDNRGTVDLQTCRTNTIHHMSQQPRRVNMIFAQEVVANKLGMLVFTVIS